MTDVTEKQDDLMSDLLKDPFDQATPAVTEETVEKKIR